ncbi:hypothetical protein GCM10029976_005640 [Kribbella albertanoniae]
MTVEVSAPNGGAVAEQIVQAFSVSGQTLTPDWAATNGAARWQGRLHPRISGTLPELELDLTFVDMTAVLAVSLIALVTRHEGAAERR